MDDTSTTIANLGQSDEEILTYTVSDEALEASAGTEWDGTGPYTVLHYGCEG
jgi:hypothetical protein